jgi:hypothetical protein
MASGDFYAPNIFLNSFFGAEKSPDAIYLTIYL